MTTTTDTGISADLERQREYVQQLELEGFEFGLTIADAFVRGIRDIGYKDTSRSLDELIDNAIQAEARNILVLFGYGKTDKKPESIAVVDDGHGMDPQMARLSAIWGGTHRENDRTGFGRYGYGLPSACVSMGERFQVFSRVAGEQLHAVTFDLDAIRKGTHSRGTSIVMPEAEPAELPAWLDKEIKKRLGPQGLEHGTVVLIDKLDRVKPKTTAALEPMLLQNFGVTYRNYLRHTGLFVNNKQVDPVDPLFITPGFRFYDLDEDRAEPLEAHSFDVRDPNTRKVTGTVRVRYSYMPPTFARADKTKPGGSRNLNARFGIMDANNGLIITRQGRQIDVIPRGEHLKVNNDDRYWGCEIDMPATLDEEMSITTSKQQIVLSDRMWELLREHGVFQNIRALRKRYDDEKAKDTARSEEDEALARSSEQAMAEAEKFRSRKPTETQEQRERSKRLFDLEVERRARASGLPPEEIEPQLEAEAEKRPYKVEDESMPGAPFFRVEPRGGQKVLYLNTAHTFYQKVYAGPESTPRLRAALEVLLFVIGAAELDADGEKKTFYEIERGVWSQDLHAALTTLERIDSARDTFERREDADADEAAA